MRAELGEANARIEALERMIKSLHPAAKGTAVSVPTATTPMTTPTAPTPTAPPSAPPSTPPTTTDPTPGGGGDPGCSPTTYNSICASCRPGLSPCRIASHVRWLNGKPYLTLAGTVGVAAAEFWAIVTDPVTGNLILGVYLLSPVQGIPCVGRPLLKIDGSEYNGDAAIELQTPITVVTPTGEWGTYLDARTGGESADWMQVKDGRCECSIECAECVRPVVGDDFHGETDGGVLLLVHLPAGAIAAGQNFSLRIQLTWCDGDCSEYCPVPVEQCDKVPLSECIPRLDLLDLSRPGPELDWCSGPVPPPPPIGPGEEAEA